MNNQLTLRILEQTIVRQAAALTEAQAEIAQLTRRGEEALKVIEAKSNKLCELQPAVQIYDDMLKALKRYFLNGPVPLPAIVAAKKVVPVVTVGQPECGALPGGRILPFQVTYSVDGSEYSANFVLVPALEPGRGLNEIFPDFKPAQWVAEKKPSVGGKKKTKPSSKPS